MMKYYLARLLLCSVVAVTLAACGGAGAGSNNPSGSNNPAGSSDIVAVTGNTVHMSTTEFVSPSVSIAQGTSLTMVADTFVPHFLSNGTWENGTAKPAREPGAPELEKVHIDGNSSGAIGPFTTAGTFQIYCTIHPGMNLTVAVQ
jgi:plastocyanin